MMRNEFNSSLKGLIAEVERQGEDELESIVGFTLTEESRQIALLIYNLSIKTEYFQQDTKSYLCSRYGSYRRVNRREGCSSNAHTAASRIRYDMKKLQRFLGVESCKAFFDGTVIDIERYKKELAEMIKKYEYRAFFADYWIKPAINLDEVETVEVLSEEERLDFELLQKYGSKEGKKVLEEIMNKPRIVGYLKSLSETKIEV